MENYDIGLVWRICPYYVYKGMCDDTYIYFVVDKTYLVSGCGLGCEQKSSGFGTRCRIVGRIGMGK